MLKGMNAVVTGCARGIGRAILDAFVANRIKTVWACAREYDEEFDSYCSVLDTEETRVNPVYFDFENHVDVKGAAKRIMSEVRIERKGIDILVNNAGVADDRLSYLTREKDLSKMINVNFFSQTFFTQYFVRAMIADRNSNCSIINMASTAAVDGNAGRFAYAASKAAVIAGSKVLSREVGKYGIRVNTVLPGIIETRMFRGNNAEMKVIEDSSLGRTGLVEEVAGVVVFLASEMSSYITGQAIRVDGGM